MIRVVYVILLTACTVQTGLDMAISGTTTISPTTTTTTMTMTETATTTTAMIRTGVAIPPVQTTTTASTTTTILPPAVTITTMAKPELPQFTLGQLVDYFFTESDRPWALKVALCESSGLPDHVSSDAVHPSSRASGWFQHLPKFWDERSVAAGFADHHILDPIANVGVAAWLLYEGGGKSHWYPSESCWK